MKIDYHELAQTYEDFFDAQQNQLDIFNTTRSSISELIELETFSGKSADRAKSYLGDVHLSVLDTFNMALMEMEIRLHNLEDEFLETVDSSTKAIIDTEYIKDAIDTIKGYQTDLLGLDGLVQGIYNSSADLIILKSMSCQKIDDYLEDAKAEAGNTKKTLENFNTSHKSDLSSVTDMLSNMEAAFTYMKNVSSPQSIRHSMTGDPFQWLQNLRGYSFDAVIFAMENDPDFEKTIYVGLLASNGMLEMLTMLDVWSTIGDLGDIVGMGKDAVEGTLALSTLLKLKDLYRMGAKFIVSSDGVNMFLRIESVSGIKLTTTQMEAIMSAAKLDIGDNALTTIFNSRGIQIFGKNGELNTHLFTNIADTADAMSDVKAYAQAGDVVENAVVLSKTGKVLKKVGDVLTVVGIVVSAGVVAYDTFYDERTQSFGKPDASEAVSGLLVEAADFGIGVGLAAIPVAGPFLAIGWAAALFIKFGEPKQNLVDHAKDWADEACEDFGNWFAKVFW